MGIEKPPDSRSRLKVCAGSMSVTVISIHVMSATVIIYDRRYGPVGAERARPPGAGGNGALRRAWVRADHGGGDRRAGGADGTDVLPALCRQTRGPVRGRGHAAG